MDQLEPAFRTLLKALPESHRQLLETYLSALQDLERSRTLLAYQLGREHSP